MKAKTASAAAVISANFERPTHCVVIRMPGVQQFWIIDNFDRIEKLWMRALRRNEFFEIRCAGRRYLLNPHCVSMITGRPRTRRRRWWRRGA
jgi:hypothetical protein